MLAEYLTQKGKNNYTFISIASILCIATALYMRKEFCMILLSQQVLVIAVNDYS